MKPMLPILLPVLLLASTPKPGSSQTDDLYTMPVPELLSAFVDEQSARSSMKVSNLVDLILTQRRRPSSEIAALISGLDSLARGGGTRHVEGQATVLLILAAVKHSQHPPYSRVPQLILDLFEETDENLVRMPIVRYAGQLPDKSVAVRILRRVLTEEPPPFVVGPGLEARIAVGAAQGAGPPGLALLRELHATDAIRDGGAKAMVSELSASGRLRGGGNGE